MVKPETFAESHFHTLVPSPRRENESVQDSHQSLVPEECFSSDKRVRDGQFKRWREGRVMCSNDEGCVRACVYVGGKDKQVGGAVALCDAEI